jgi:hypothetical protein
MATSNFIAAGWDVTSGGSTILNQSGQQVSNVSSRDIFNGMLTFGVYCITSDSNRYPAFCSCNDLRNIGIPQDSDDAWIVYPGYGIKLYSNTDWSGDKSNLYYNTGTNPVCFATRPDWGVTDSSGDTTATLVCIEGSTTTRFGYNNSQSIRVYFRGNRSDNSENEITIGGLTS